MARNAIPSSIALRALMSLLIAAWSCAGAQAIDPLRSAEIVSDAAAQDDKRTGKARFFDPADGQLDLSYFLENPKGFLPIPIVITEPAVGYGGGIAGMFLRPRREAGDEGWSRPDISGVGAFATQNGTWGAFGGDATRWVDGRLRTLVGAARAREPRLLRARPRACERQRSRQVFAAIQRRGRAGQLAARAEVGVVRRDALRLRQRRAEPARQSRVPRPGRSRPRQGVGTDGRARDRHARQRVHADERRLRRVVVPRIAGSAGRERRLRALRAGPARLASACARRHARARANYAWSSDGTPFFLRPYVQLRGVPAMRYQGDQAASLEVEARWQFIGRWSAVVFGGGGTTRTEKSLFSATQNVGSGGVGFRYEIASRFGLHVGIDVAHSPGTTAFYLVVGNAWFRP
jgi:hypothetical protein